MLSEAVCLVPTTKRYCYISFVLQGMTNRTYLKIVRWHCTGANSKESLPRRSWGLGHLKLNLSILNISEISHLFKLSLLVNYFVSRFQWNPDFSKTAI